MKRGRNADKNGRMVEAAATVVPLSRKQVGFEGVPPTLLWAVPLIEQQKSESFKQAFAVETIKAAQLL